MVKNPLSGRFWRAGPTQRLWCAFGKPSLAVVDVAVSTLA
jgi:hypothetical protein